MITFDEALEIVTDEVGAQWASDGTFYVGPEGWQDDEDYLVQVGAREAIVEGDLDYEIDDDMVTFVDKFTGEVHRESYMFEEVQKKIDGMTPVIADGIEEQ